MGTNQKITQQRIKRRVRIGAFFLIPFILIGGGTIIFQLTSGDGNLGSFDFNIGKLWSWATTPNEPEPASVESEYDQVITPLPKYAKQPEVTKADQIPTVKVRPKRSAPIITGSQVSSRPDDRKQPFKLVEVNTLNPPNTFNYLSSGRHIDLQKKEYLIPQDIETVRSRVAVGASFAPGISYRRLGYHDINSVARVENQTAYTYGQSKEFRNNNDRPIMNFYSGIDVYVNLNKRWSIQSGFYYSSHGEKLLVINKNEPSPMNSKVSEESAFLNRQSVFDSPEMVDYTANEELPFSNYYGLMEVPLIVGYQALELNEMLHVNVQLGASYGYLDHADVLMYNYETNKYFWIPSSNFSLINKHFLSGIAGVEVAQYISKEIEIFANPQFKYALTPTFKSDYEIKQNQWAVGMRMGMKVHL